MVKGTIDNGFIARYLKSNSEEFSCTSGGHDAQLTESSTTIETVVVAAIGQALTVGETILINGSGNVEVMTKTNKIVNDVVGFSAESAAAYAISKNSDVPKLAVPLD